MSPAGCGDVFLLPVIVVRSNKCLFSSMHRYNYRFIFVKCFEPIVIFIRNFDFDIYLFYLFRFNSIFICLFQYLFVFIHLAP